MQTELRPNIINNINIKNIYIEARTVGDQYGYLSIPITFTPILSLTNFGPYFVKTLDEIKISVFKG